MKKTGYAIIGLGALGALWAGGWYAVKSYVVEPEADRVVAQMREGRLFLSYDKREIGGFPFGYDVAYTGVKLSDPSALWSWRAPWATISPEAGGAVLRAAPKSRLTLSPGALGGAPDGAPTVFDISAKDMVIRLSGDEAAGLADIAAPSLTATQIGESEAALSMRIEASNLTGKVNFASGSSAVSGVVEADEINSHSVVAQVDGDVARASRVQGARMAFDADLAGAASLGGFLAADGRAKLDFTARSFTGGGDDAGAATSVSSGPVEVQLSIVDGRARYVLASSEASLNGLIAAISPLPIPGGAVSLDDARLVMEMPLRRSDGLAPYMVEIALTGLAPEQGVWNMFDPAGKLDHAPMNVALTLGGDALVLSDFTGADSGPPIDLQTLEVEAATLSALGMTADATGGLTLDGAENVLNGAVTLRVRGALGLLDNLADAGLLPREAARAYAMAALQYARPGAGEDELVSKIVARDGAITINGQPIGQ